MESIPEGMLRRGETLLRPKAANQLEPRLDRSVKETQASRVKWTDLLGETALGVCCSPVGSV